MAGSKRNRIKKALLPTSKSVTPPEPPSMDDDELLDDLVAQLDAKDSNVQTEAASVIMQIDSIKADELASDTKKDGRSRFEARKARKAAEKAEQYTNDDTDADAQLEREAKEEETVILRICNEHGLSMHEINPDGHCLFAAVADQLRLLNILPAADANFATTRQAASTYIYNHVNDFLPFLPSDEAEDGSSATEPGIMGPREFERYCAKIRDTGVWGGEPEILALSRAYDVPICVVQKGTPSIVVHSPTGETTFDRLKKRAVWISYHRRMYGLGEHYNSLRPKTITQQLQAIIS